ncbi:formimidoylglutamate deiminase [Roseomonas sp. NAR14]|uniref:Formimidoylglutamate deiminase n=1 Tax=Roseomonas acroporae TaxID=2937791 RepID=A0A9X1YB68_9PROT|nr:formimidoylglutamate deiminase [Roseomonas acroporae]MCK8787209.1 formimidoylglutamate deiminase [Roseomonas acroporae]
MTPALFARRALLPAGWASDVRIESDPHGTIVAVTPDSPARDDAERLSGSVIPGLPNLHSHAFQRAMAGGAERRSPPEARAADGGHDSFWTWRDTMYRFVGLLSPDDAEAVAAQLYVECLEAGYTAVAEFHYLHHAPDGRPYADRAEMALRHLEAARQAGIGITMLPSLYRHGGIFGREPAPGQRRFLNDLDGFSRIVQRVREAVEGDPQAGWGVAPHSLRAVTPTMLHALAGLDAPIHIHAAEQRREVAECVAATGARPVRWLLDHAPLDARWCLIHCTHMEPDEVRDLAATSAVAGLCPTTEASLGDGLFALPGWLAAGGMLGIGSDSQVSSSPREELRQLETGQRLALRQRSVATDAANPHPGRVLVEAALAGGARASGRPIGAIAPGMRCDLVELDISHPSLVGYADDALLDAWILGATGNATRNPVRSVHCGGARVVTQGRHVEAEAVASAFASVMRRLLTA